ncbi:hypothetical protein KGG93_gp28 [Streptomyces phage Endor2]|uniref:Uncharacterized protein n=1 Tax=Streptomyces phage Endor2 TaxID=2740182 RepID=A0A7G4AX33_9CAUD|nr:hypothetical protein KGG93_gp28 [Streptomyces phage Endor2]QMP84573.1 hypothetical protein HUN44_00028 [Streptomyces phage Endor2]
MGKHSLPLNPSKESFVTLLLPLLPAKARPYAKAILAFLGTVASVATLLYADDPRVAAGVQILTALGVYAQPNGSTGEDEFPEDGLPESAYQG